METIGLHGYVMEQLGKTGLTYQQTGDGSGVPKRTVEKIARGEIVDPGVSHCEKLAAFFEELAAAPGETERARYEALMAKRAKAA